MKEDINYTTVTELPGQGIPKEQLQRLYSRYRFAAQFCEGKDVLEVACGGGMGLGYLAKKTRRVVGTDVDAEILKVPLEYYKDRDNISVTQMDAHKFLFEDKSFDVVILYEAIYYLENPREFIKEAWRVLRNDGVLVIGTVNKDWQDFNPSPFSKRYFSVPELRDLIKEFFAEVNMFAAFSTKTNSFKDIMVSWVKRLAVKAHLIPKTMKSKEFLKKVFFGRLRPMPYEITEGTAAYSEPASISFQPTKDYKIIYAVARKV
ncbi:MAG: class I SAM-dependent methyltransferase, partial [Candidatus Omnitrophica bacterium]|nr:class I SAM-dependent methyltransferase [Candidatus Omnitrophota bacterium]